MMKTLTSRASNRESRTPSFATTVERSPGPTLLNAREPEQVAAAGAKGSHVGEV